ncbi:hypothetical protein RHSIM_Rhsim10G0020700 [Rhododendron simsii]|uniref:Uncharacterized protein n=1 Tax=Rhododendron simsii TaxID=118357 RepID=A0A834GA33_RHOSS|nr:hypothetical protein RHSIM_Rhsim10G0020700 [Rhododendron simsii]
MADGDTTESSSDEDKLFRRRNGAKKRVTEIRFEACCENEKNRAVSKKRRPKKGRRRRRGSSRRTGRSSAVCGRDQGCVRPRQVRLRRPLVADLRYVFQSVTRKETERLRSGGGWRLTESAAEAVKIIGVEPLDSNKMALSLHHYQRVELEKVGQYADGVVVEKVGNEAFSLCRELIDGNVHVGEDTIQ